MSNHYKAALFFISVLIILAVAKGFMAVPLWYFITTAALWLLVAIIGSSFISSGYHVKTWCGNPSETQKRISLTFDDGPHEMTEAVLDVLKKHQTKATFFCIGKNIEKHPHIFERIIAEGHLIGNHSYSHSRFFDFYRKDRVLTELIKTDQLIEQQTGHTPMYFRPPYGVTNPSIRRALAVTGHKVIGWNIRSLDGVIKNENTIFNRIIKRIAPGGIVLLHDTSIQTVNVLERLLVTLREKNYEVVPLGQLLNIKAYEN